MSHTAGGVPWTAFLLLVGFDAWTKPEIRPLSSVPAATRQHTKSAPWLRGPLVIFKNRSNPSNCYPQFVKLWGRSRHKPNLLNSRSGDWPLRRCPQTHFVDFVDSC